ncbi:MAG TPA: hypothetical protein DD670_05215 [Planctomycetaceae bacterium]|nr:hypothetical protein [Planctomycetaceae bacterium]
MGANARFWKLRGARNGGLSAKLAWFRRCVSTAGDLRVPGFEASCREHPPRERPNRDNLRFSPVTLSTTEFGTGSC